MTPHSVICKTSDPNRKSQLQGQVEGPESAVGQQAGADADHQRALTVDAVDVGFECGGELHGSVLWTVCSAVCG